MDKVKKFFDYLFNNQTALGIVLLRKLAFIIPDRLYLKAMFRLKMGYPLDLKNPQTFNEKLQWLKLYNRKSEYTQMVDKYAVKEYVAKIIGKEYIIPTIGVWDKFEQIDFSALPERFVLKTTNGGGGGGVVICNDKNHLDITDAKKRLEKSLSSDIYRNLREWPYKNVKKRIIAEEFKQDSDGELKDYKFFCFNGKVEFFKIDFSRFVNHHANYYDRNGELLPFGEADFPPLPEKVLDIPKNLSKMIEIAERLSTGIPLLRVDLYNIDDRIYFGELTFFPASGLGQFVPPKWDKILSKYLTLPPLYTIRSNSIFQVDCSRYVQRNVYPLRFLYWFRKAQMTHSHIIKTVSIIFLKYYKYVYGLEISYKTSIGKGLYLGHARNITINPNAIIGEYCNIHKGCVIGQENRGPRKGVPYIGDKVWIGINAAIVGGISIGNDVLIAPNSYVNINVPSHSVVFGNPCIIKHKENATESYINIADQTGF